MFAQTFFGHFNCRHLQEDVPGVVTIAVLDKDYSEPCYETTWWILAVISGLGIVFISFGVPFGMYYWMTKEMNKQMDEVRYGTDPDRDAAVRVQAINQTWFERSHFLL